jgi:outer membrane receptor for Fe3+-dicitrate
MPNSPRHQVALDVEYKVDSHWVAGVNLFGQSMQYIDPGNTSSPAVDASGDYSCATSQSAQRCPLSADGFTLFNPRIGYRWAGKGYQGELMLQARNLFGLEYFAFTEPDPDGNSFQPGPTREAFVGFRIMFGGK